MLASNIKKLRKKHHLSQDQLARKANLSYSSFVKIEQGLTKNLTLETLVKLANVFEITIDELINMENKKEEKKHES